MIVPTLARLLIREHQYKPIDGKVLILGRQTISMSPENLLELLHQEKLSISDEKLNRIKIGVDQKTRLGKGQGYVNDEVFFDLFGISEVNIMDVSAYEGADIIHDLNKPIPKSLENQFDFIIDGGTFDHLVDVRCAFENVVRMLKPGGRIFQWNAASNFTGGAYISFGPDLFYDFYVLNKFADCKVYIVEIDNPGQQELWDFYEFNGADKYSDFLSKRLQMTVVLAEKGTQSTYDLLPIQANYRDNDLWQTYRDNQKIISLSGRRSLIGSKVGQKLCSKSISYVPESLAKRFFLRLKEKGIIWVYKRIIAALNGRGKPYGYTYIGKI